MPLPADPADPRLTRLAAMIDDACRVVESYRPRGVRRRGGAGAPSDPLSLLDQCLVLCAERDAQRPEPIRTLHHFACTGGTLISKCLAAMPNVQLLSEVDPLSTIQRRATDTPQFAPTDMIRLLRQSVRGVGDATITDIFESELAIVLADCNRRGLRLVLRDHTHSHFCLGDGIPERPTLRDLAGRLAPVLSVVTVRHPLDSYMSLHKLGWDTYRPQGLDEYCRRYLAFLDCYKAYPLLRYEDFVTDPETWLHWLCNHLELPFNAEFRDLIGVFGLTGDSGRKGEDIAPRPRRSVPEDVAVQAERSGQLGPLLERMGYAD